MRDVIHDILNGKSCLSGNLARGYLHLTFISHLIPPENGAYSHSLFLLDFRSNPELSDFLLHRVLRVLVRLEMKRRSDTMVGEGWCSKE